jgi:DNA-directed RNA polymerase subunit N (RpoN/RPB10)
MVSTEDVYKLQVSKKFKVKNLYFWINVESFFYPQEASDDKNIAKSLSFLGIRKNCIHRIPITLQHLFGYTQP